jgi:hypothetical protein
VSLDETSDTKIHQSSKTKNFGKKIGRQRVCREKKSSKTGKLNKKSPKEEKIDKSRGRKTEKRGNKANPPTTPGYTTLQFVPLSIMAESPNTISPSKRQRSSWFR